MSIRISYKIDKEHFIKHIKHIRGLVFVKNTLFGGFVEKISAIVKNLQYWVVWVAFSHVCPITLLENCATILEV